MPRDLPWALRELLAFLSTAVWLATRMAAAFATLLDVFGAPTLFEGVLNAVDDLLATPTVLLLASAVEKLVELLLINIAVAVAFLDLLLELVDLLEVLAFLLMLLGLLVGLNGFMEFLVLHAGLLLLEVLHLLLLLEEARLDLGHVFIRFKHLREEVVRARDRDLGLDQDLHALHHILSCQVVEGDLTLDVVVHGKGLRDHQGLVIG